MPTITIRDEQGDEILTVDPSSKSLGKYLRSAASLRSLVPLARVASRPLQEADGSRELAFALEKDVAIGHASDLTIGGGASAALGVQQAGGVLLAGSDLQAPVTVPNGTAYVSLALEARLNVGVTTQKGSVGFGFNAGTGVRYAYSHPFDIVGAQLTVGDGIRTALESAVLPVDAGDLDALPVGAFVSLAGEGELSFSIEAAMSSSATLLATPGLPIVGSARVAQGASLSVKAAWQAGGEFELRLSRPSASEVRLAYYRRRGRTLSVSAKGTAGVSATLGDSDLIAALMRAISPDPEADLRALVNAGLDDEQIAAIQGAVAASVDRTLTVAAQLQVSSLRDDEALFDYAIDPSRLDADGRAAVDDALHGRLSALDRLSEQAGTPPVRLVTSMARRLRERRTSWRFNLLGILNVASFSELIRDGSVTYDPVAGALTAADRISAKRIRITSLPFAADPEKLRRVLFESLMVTAAYSASRALGAQVSLTADHVYLEQRGKTKRADLEDHYRALIALGLCDTRERDTRLGALADFGSSTFAVENHFDAVACDAMFLDADGQPCDEAHYERLARGAFLALLPADDPTRSYRRFALESDAAWVRLRQLGAAIDEGLPGHIRNDAIRREVVRGDVVTIAWWATAMGKAGASLAEMRRFLGQRDAAGLRDDAAFVRARAKLEKALADVVANTAARFDDPWDVLAMDAAAARLGRLESAIISTRFAARYVEAEAGPAFPGPGAPGERAMKAPAVRSPEAERPWTAEEIDVFKRHVVNLREGKLSTGGTFSSSTGQVTKIFSDHLPAYVRAQLAAGQRPRILFFAHGGLVEEREGLLPVLARRRFWDLNGVYPVYFVWETGLTETLRDLIGLPPGVAPKSRGGLADAAIERLARSGGKPVWGQMKSSAEKASGPGGGARLVAGLASALWKQFDGAPEFHALGHSAGAIFHAHFLPQLVGTGQSSPSISTLHLLAPAITTELFEQRLMKLVGAGLPITRLAMYTMREELERADSSMKPYGKSLLYLVSRAFENKVDTPILGLEESLLQNSRLIRFFGLAGTQKVADVVFSVTEASARPAERSASVRHGGFDNDPATMTSVVRRVLDAPDTAAVVDYFEDPVDGFERGAVITRGALAPAAHAAPAMTAAPAVRRQVGRTPWTVMVWMAGDNDLEDFGTKDLMEMKRVGSSDRVNVVAQFDSMRDDRTRRYHVRPASRLDEDVVEQLGETNTGDPAVATDFFTWAMTRYPADRFMAVIWNHGSGIDETDVYRRARARGTAVVRGTTAGERQVERRLVRTAMSSRYRRSLFSTTVAQAVTQRGIAYDDTARDFLDNVELKRVLTDVTGATGRRLDVLGFDACLMNMLEVAYQLRGAADVMVGSEELEPGDGWPYDRVLGWIGQNAGSPGAALGPVIVKEYVDSYQAGNLTQSALDLGRLGPVMEAVNQLGTALAKGIKAGAEYGAVTKALNAAQRFDTEDFVDLGDFCAQLTKRSTVAGVRSAAKAVRDALAGTSGLVLAASSKGSAVRNASGVAIYLPARALNKTYKRLDFAKASSWTGFLEAYHRA
jgi:hypothetical protein